MPFAAWRGGHASQSRKKSGEALELAVDDAESAASLSRARPRNDWVPRIERPALIEQSCSRSKTASVTLQALAKTGGCAEKTNI